MIFLCDEKDFQLQGDQVIYFYASWMPFYTRMLNILDKMEEKYKTVNFYAIDVDNFKNLCIRFSIESVPQMLLFKQGKRKKDIKGIVLMSAVKHVFSDIYGN